MIDKTKFTTQQLEASELAAQAARISNLSQWMSKQDAKKADAEVSRLRNQQREIELAIEAEIQQDVELTRSGRASYDDGDLLFAA